MYSTSTLNFRKTDSPPDTLQKARQTQAAPKAAFFLLLSPLTHIVKASLKLIPRTHDLSKTSSQFSSSWNPSIDFNVRSSCHALYQNLSSPHYQLQRKEFDTRPQIRLQSTMTPATSDDRGLLPSSTVANAAQLSARELSYQQKENGFKKRRLEIERKEIALQRKAQDIDLEKRKFENDEQVFALKKEKEKHNEQSPAAKRSRTTAKTTTRGGPRGARSGTTKARTSGRAKAKPRPKPRPKGKLRLSENTIKIKDDDDDDEYRGSVTKKGSCTAILDDDDTIIVRRSDSDEAPERETIYHG
jgi:hypothetical protein